MSSKILISFIILIGFTNLSNAQNAKSLTSTNEFTIRTGINVSHWLSQSEKRGNERKNYITKSDFDLIAQLGFDHVRIPIDEEQMWDINGKKEKEAFELLHNGIKWALSNNLRVIVDLHIIRSHYFNATTNTLWTNPAEQKKLADMWLQLSDELKQYPNSMVAYEILNEAVADNPEDWNLVLNNVLKAIRIKEPYRKIVVGSNRWQSAETFPELKIPKDDRNIILSFHFYTPLALTHHKAPWTPIAEYDGPINYPGQIVDTIYYKNLSAPAVELMRNSANGFYTKEIFERIIAPAIQKAEEYKLPLYCGEFGVFPTIPDSIRLKWYQDVCDIFKKNNIAYCHWNYKADFPIVDDKGMADKKLISILIGRSQ